jgi:hypothetical protein
MGGKSLTDTNQQKAHKPDQIQPPNYPTLSTATESGRSAALKIKTKN